MKKTLIINTLVLFIANMIFAQNKISNDVQVVGPYQPTISDAYKINMLPKIVDTTKVESKFDYSIETKQIPTGYSLEPIVAASMLGEPLTKLYHTYIKAGFGNYYSPMLQVNYHVLRSRVASLGVNAGHFSSNSKIKLNKDEKVNAATSNNYVTVFGKRFFNKKTLSGDVNFNRKVYHHYGYDVNNDSSNIVFNNYKQRYMLLNANVGFNTNNTDSTLLNYAFDLSYDYVQDINNFYQHSIKFSPSFDQLYGKTIIGLNSDVNYYNKNQTIDTMQYLLVRLKPFANFAGPKWKVNMGLNICSEFYDQLEEYRIYPNVYMHYSLVQNILMLYAGYDGDVEENDYKKIITENPYIQPNLNVKNTYRSINFYAGFRGKLSSKTSFNLKGSYEEYKNMYFYINSLTPDVNSLTIDSSLNHFEVEYDFVDRYRVYGEISTKPSEKFNMLLKGNYYYYNFMRNLSEPWHKPNYDVTLTVNYNLRSKIVLNTDFFVIGKRYAKSYNPAIEKIKLKEIFDLNLGIEYRYSKNLSAFLNFNNIAASKYQIWNYYPTQRFNVMFGLSYSL